MSFHLVQRLQKGAQGDDAELRSHLSIEGPLDDAALGRALVRELATGELVLRHEWPPPGDAAAPPAAAPHTDVRSVVALARSGTLAERRRAVLRLAAALTASELPEGEVEVIDEALSRARDLDVGHELLVARRALPGAASAEVRAEDAAARAVLGRLNEAILSHWDGQTKDEPIGALLPEELALVALRLREAPAAVASHVAALIEGADAALDLEGRRAVIDAFRHAGDPRLVPALTAVLSAEPQRLGRAAARALARIEDPRVKPALSRAYKKSAQPEDRAAIAGALGLVGEPTGRAWVRALLSTSDVLTLKIALDAMATLGLPEDVDRIAPLLSHASPDVVVRAIRALGRTGDGRALERLRRRAKDGLDGALALELDEAELQITARLELRGEAPPPFEARGPKSSLATGPRAALAEAAPRPGAGARLRAFFDWVVARVWLALGFRESGLRRLELAAARRPDWAAPLVTLGESYPSHESAHALSALRRAVERDRAWVERHAARLVARVFLRRADESAKSGRSEVARGLLEEVLALDLRRVPSSLRFEIERRLGALRGDGA